MPKIIAIAPHKTFVDPFLMGVAFPPMPSGVGKKELLDIPFMKYCAIANQCICVDRKHQDSKNSCKEVIASHGHPDWPGPPMIIFPEGTTTNGKVLIQFKLGPFCPGQPVLPVLLKYPFNHYDPSWCGDNGNLGIAILRTMLQFANFCEIVIQDPYFPSDEEKRNAILFASNVRKQMCVDLGVGTTEHSYDDLFLSAAANKARIDQDFVVSEVRSKYDLDLEQLKKMLKEFQKVDKNKTGTLNSAEFVKALRATDGGLLSDDATLEQLFTFFDVDNSGEISYREFIQGVSIFSGKCSNEARARLAFLVFDVSGTSRVSVDALEKALDTPLEHDADLEPDSSSLGARIRAGAGDLKELDFENFCKLIEKEPQVVEEAMNIARQRFGFGNPNQQEADS